MCPQLGKLQRHGVSASSSDQAATLWRFVQVNTCCKRGASLSVSARRRVGALTFPGMAVRWRIVRGTVVAGRTMKATAIGSSRKRCNAHPEKPCRVNGRTAPGADCRTYEDKNIDRLSPAVCCLAAAFLTAFVETHRTCDHYFGAQNGRGANLCV
jgi:hypothetical protein